MSTFLVMKDVTRATCKSVRHQMVKGYCPFTSGMCYSHLYWSNVATAEQQQPGFLSLGHFSPSTFLLFTTVMNEPHISPNGGLF